MTEANGRNRSALALAVAAQIRAERAASGLTQRQVIAASRLPKSTYLRLESGERVADVSQLAAFCESVGLSLHVFMERAEARVAGLEDRIKADLPPAVAADVDRARAHLAAQRKPKKSTERPTGT